MKPRRLLVLLGLLAAIAAGFALTILGHRDQPVPKPASKFANAFSTLRLGDRLIVRFQSVGCFGASLHELTFSRAKESTVSIIQLMLASGQATQTNHVNLGTLTLSKSDVAGLDKLMDFYESTHGNGCTQIDHLEITLLREDKPIATAEITDASCLAHEIPGIRSFDDLVCRLVFPSRLPP